MYNAQKNLGTFLLHLDDKGFKLKEDAISFIYFGKQLTGSDDYLVSIAIELTLKTQKRFDGSFYLSLLETFIRKNIKTKKQAYDLADKLGMLA
ncbi:DUF6123 family protein [Bacillus sp. FJAT-50079]|uniref:DUF6123 family protein n=1 Tax=Bacillus sp. FJAT-50079 TaxID=2833577 RepID=UPI001BCA5BE8|nr:DUF6123 family protein [Bacillus sp. FJAT-50079]MBS4209822.1 hypothetical protein [Bacillus sp. FJAT-50079]